MTRFALTILITTLVCAPLQAGDEKPARDRGVSTTAENQLAPARPPKPTDKIIVADEGPGLDTGCTYRAEGPLRIELPIARYVGEVDASGKLTNPALLKSNGALSQFATLTLPMWDVDASDGEVDLVYINGHAIGQLTGRNESWVPNTFKFPTEYLRFGHQWQQPGINVLEVEIDATAAGWCTAVDWVQIEFDAVAPIAFIHGTASDGESCWHDSGMPEYLYSIGFPEEHQIDLKANGSIRDNGLALEEHFQNFAHRFGTRSAHVVTHSKGGNDIREFLANYHHRSPVRILSLHTLSATFHGTVLADIAAVSGIASSTPDIAKLIAADIFIDSWYPASTLFGAPCCKAVADQRPGAMLATNTRLGRVDPEVKFYNFAADADLNDDGVISTNENGVYPLDSVADASYQILSSVWTVKAIQVPTVITPAPGLAVPITVSSLEIDSTIASAGNDLVVTVESAQYPCATYVGQVNADHLTIKAPSQMAGIVSRIKADYPLNGVPQPPPPCQ
ncbi:MAG TPA: hypothetical protein VEK57_21670 [Thermoanaerobaculia bacterium]|nr:hypothetical protein [Thermoanaerobaculia bacterium]